MNEPKLHDEVSGSSYFERTLDEISRSVDVNRPAWPCSLCRREAQHGALVCEACHEKVRQWGLSAEVMHSRHEGCRHQSAAVGLPCAFCAAELEGLCL